jgi:hypothetical protein
MLTDLINPEGRNTTYSCFLNNLGNLSGQVERSVAYGEQITLRETFLILNFVVLASFIFILRYQSSIPTLGHFSYRLIANTTSCFIDRTVPYLIVRLKALWLILLTIISCFAFIVIFQWPKLQFDVCHLTFDTLPYHLSSNTYEKSLKTFDIDITYYIGSHWEVPNESLIPLRDIPIFDYTSENRMTSKPDGADTFVYALKDNLSQLIQFCSSVQQKINKKHSLRNISNNR